MSMARYGGRSAHIQLVSDYHVGSTNNQIEGVRHCEWALG